jgi:5'-nucleotidase
VTGLKGVVKVGITGGVVDPIKPGMTRVLNTSATIDAIQEQCNIMRDAGATIFIALMHQALADDSNLAAQVDDLDMIVGGHEHDNYFVYRSYREIPIFRADANARTVYVHDLYYNTTSGALKVQSRLQHINSGFADDAVLAERVKFWTDAAFAGFKAAGFNATEVVAKLTVSYNVLEVYVRANVAPIGMLVADAMLDDANVVAKGAQFAIINSGAFRLDDYMYSGNITQYDVLRMLPFGNSLQVWNMTTAALINALDVGFAADAQGTGGFMQPSSNLKLKAANGGYYAINGVNLNVTDPNTPATWTVASIDFLWNSGTGPLKAPRNMVDFRINTGSSTVGLGDQRQSVLAYLKKMYPATA